MKYFLFFIFSTFIVNTLTSQCNYNIYPQYINITAAQTITAQNNYYWICENVVLTVDSSLAGTFFMEQNSKIIFTKASRGCDAVYAKSSCTVINTSKGCVAITANPSNVTVQNTGSGSAVIGFTCPVVNYIYNGVSGPCLNTNVNEIPVDHQNLQIYPNPNNGKFNIELIQNSDVCVTNFIGQIVLLESFFNGRNLIDLSNQPNGIYFLRVSNKSSKQTYKLIKE